MHQHQPQPQPQPGWATPQQLDIFDDSRDLALRNTLAQALLAGDATAAKQAADALQAEFSTDPVLVPARRLIEHQLRQQSPSAGATVSPDTVLAVRQQLDGPLASAAAQVLGPRDAAA